VFGEAGGADAAVGFAEEEFGGSPAAIFADPAADEVADGFDVLVEAVELGGFGVAFGAGVSGGDGVDEDEVGDIEDGVGVLDGAGRWGEGLGAVGGGGDEAGAEGAEVEPDGGGAGAAVEGEDDGAVLGLVDAGADLTDVEHVGPRVALGVLELELGGGDGVVDDLAGDGDGAFLDDDLFLVVLGGLFLLLLFGVGFFVVLGGGERDAEGEEEGEEEGEGQGEGQEGDAHESVGCSRLGVNVYGRLGVRGLPWMGVGVAAI